MVLVSTSCWLLAAVRIFVPLALFAVTSLLIITTTTVTSVSCETVVAAVAAPDTEVVRSDQDALYNYREEPTRKDYYDDSPEEWAIHIPGGIKVAKKVSRSHGFEIKQEIPPLPDHYLISKLKSPRRSRRSAEHLTKRLSNDKRILWFERQHLKQRAKRGLRPRRLQRLYKKDAFTDTLWNEEWYLRNTISKRDSAGLNVIPCWAQNITGNGVKVTIVDDGLEWKHDDLRENYDPNASSDMNDHDNDPSPRYDPTNENRHGTRCAGEVAMVANNNICGVGVAFNAKIGGIRMLDGPITDSLEAQSLGFNHKYIDIYSSSWGPLDNGKTVEYPGVLTQKAMTKAIKEGRGGKGVLYAWASGNGGHKDNCNCDGYAASIYTITISSVTSSLSAPFYVESCAAALATTFSGGISLVGNKVVTADLHNLCTDQHSGTSASAPMAAGIFALLLEANPNLTWRDVQHLIIWTSSPSGMSNGKGWKKNAAGFWSHTHFGFGLLNALELVNAARPYKWKTVPEQHMCTATTSDFDGDLVSGGKVSILVSTDGCEGTPSEVKYLEHVIVKLDISHSNRGYLNIDVISPSGTKINLLHKREYDDSRKGFKNWPFMTTHAWGEDPLGTWKVIVTDTSHNMNVSGKVNNITLILYGTSEVPDHVIRAGGSRFYGEEVEGFRTGEDNYIGANTKQRRIQNDASTTENTRSYTSEQSNRRMKLWLRELKEKEEEQRRRWQKERERQMKRTNGDYINLYSSNDYY
ncbi:proprotein convertase subtilisin/kexin type 4-like isoform X1 [Argonauta hians]